MKISKKLVASICIVFAVALTATVCIYKKNKPHYAVVPVHYHHSTTIPIVEVEIESKKYRVAVDTGSSQCLMLYRNVLDQINLKELKGTHSFFDVHDNEYKVPFFQIPKIKISNLKVRPGLIAEESIDFVTIGSCISLPHSTNSRALEKIKYIHGRIGMWLFNHFSVYFDLPNSVIYISENESELKKNKNIDLGKHIEVPLLLNSDQVILLVETPVGAKRFLLDSGAEASIWNDTMAPPLSVLELDHMLLNGIDFGAQRFLTYKIPKPFQVDGVLGVDFFQKHAIFIDLPAKRALISL